MCYFYFGCGSRTNRVCWSLWAGAVACCALLCLATYQRAVTFNCVSSFVECRESLMESARAQAWGAADALPEKEGDSFDPQDQAILTALRRCGENIFESCDIKGSMSFLMYGLTSMMLAWVPCIFFLFCAGCGRGRDKQSTKIPTARPAKMESQKKTK